MTHLVPLADTQFAESIWIMIAKSIVIFAVRVVAPAILMLKLSPARSVVEAVRSTVWLKDICPRGNPSASSTLEP